MQKGPLNLRTRNPKPAQTLQAHAVKNQHRGGHTLRWHLPTRHQTCDNIPRTLGPQLPSPHLIHPRKHDSRTRKYLTLRTRLPFSPSQQIRRPDLGRITALLPPHRTASPLIRFPRMETTRSLPARLRFLLRRLLLPDRRAGPHARESCGFGACKDEGEEGMEMGVVGWGLCAL